ncbi:MAG TPA: DUF2306 domain-containing protein [Pseudonocardiaceae bacterium]|nr:DUF2306 domain-containing protein [Pseudonocardiaceae bacterium]
MIKVAGRGPMLQSWTLLIASHAAVATLAVVLGAFNVVRQVRGDVVHRIVGRLWVTLMLVVSLGSFWIGNYTDGLHLFLHALAAWTILSVTVGTCAARQGAIGVHRFFMLGTYLGLLGALAGVVSVPTRRIPSWFAVYPIPMTAITVGVIAAGVLTLGVIHRTASRRH